MTGFERAILFCWPALLLPFPQKPISAQAYKVIGEYKLPGASATGIAIDSGGRRIFVAGDDGVTVLNADNGANLGKVEGVRNADDILLLPEVGGAEDAHPTKGFVSAADGRVVVFNLSDLKPITTIKLRTPGPSKLCFDTDEKSVEAVSSGGYLTSIDAATNKVENEGKVPTGAGQVVCGNMDHIYVADPAANVVRVLNHKTMKDEGDVPMKSGNKPSGLALDTKGRRLFTTCEDGTIEIIDTDADFIFIELKGGTGPAHETFAWLPQGKGGWKAAAFVAQSDGTLSGIQMNAFINYSLGGQYKLAPGLGAIAFDSKPHHLLITSSNAGEPVIDVVGY